MRQMLGFSNLGLLLMMIIIKYLTFEYHLHDGTLILMLTHDTVLLTVNL